MRRTLLTALSALAVLTCIPSIAQALTPPAAPRHVTSGQRFTVSGAAPLKSRVEVEVYRRTRGQWRYVRTAVVRHYGGQVTANPYAALPSQSSKVAYHFHASGGADDGSAALPDMLAAYEDAAFDAAVWSGHDTVHESPGAAIVGIRGVEETVWSVGCMMHIVSFPATAENPSTDPQTIIDGASVAVLAHPNMNSPTIPRGDATGRGGITAAQALSLTGYDGIAVFNPYSECGEACDVWDAVLSTGRQVYGYAEDDAHALLNVGRCWNVVYADALTEATVVESLRSGRFYATQGPTLALQVGPRALTLRSDAPARLRIIGRDGALLSESEGMTLRYVYRPGDLYVRCEVIRASDGLKAWTQPVFLSRRKQAYRLSVKLSRPGRYRLRAVASSGESQLSHVVRVR